MDKLQDEAYIEAMYRDISSSEKKQRRLKSITFWRGLKIERRNTERIQRVLTLLEKYSLFPTVKDYDFGFEPKDQWITFSYVEPQLPTDFSILESNATILGQISEDWLFELTKRNLKSEREVEYFFILPLLEKLGYLRDDLAIGHRISMNQGSTILKKEADIVAFGNEEHSEGNALLLVEAKCNNKPITDDFVRQVRSYAMWLFVPYYIVTNGNELQVYMFRGSLQSDIPLLIFKTSEIRNHWGQLHKILNKSAVLKYKDKLKAHFRDLK